MPLDRGCSWNLDDGLNGVVPLLNGSNFSETDLLRTVPTTKNSVTEQATKTQISEKGRKDARFCLAADFLSLGLEESSLVLSRGYRIRNNADVIARYFSNTTSGWFAIDTQHGCWTSAFHNRTGHVYGSGSMAQKERLLP